MDYYVPARELETETRALNSRFIASIKPAQSRQEAERYLDLIRKRYPDASHHVPAYVIGHGSSVLAHTSDDGEPSGTAGRPALAVLKGSGLGDSALVITRYFGGTKLGTGGLVKAYGDAARKAVQLVPKAKKITADLLELEVAYPVYEHLLKIISNCGGVIQDQSFQVDVSLTILLPSEAYDHFSSVFNTLTRGKGGLKILKTSRPALLPIKHQEPQSTDD
jgi:uncharacterized YigZ family protein